MSALSTLARWRSSKANVFHNIQKSPTRLIHNGLLVGLFRYLSHIPPKEYNEIVIHITTCMLRHYSHAGIAISHGKFAGEMEGVALRNIKMDSRCIHAILLRPLPLTDDSWTPCTRYRCGRSIQHIVLYPSGICHHSLHNQHREHKQQSAPLLFT